MSGETAEEWMMDQAANKVCPERDDPHHDDDFCQYCGMYREGYREGQRNQIDVRLELSDNRIMQIHNEALEEAAKVEPDEIPIGPPDYNEGVLAGVAIKEAAIRTLKGEN